MALNDHVGRLSISLRTYIFGMALNTAIQALTNSARVFQRTPMFTRPLTGRGRIMNETKNTEQPEKSVAGSGSAVKRLVMPVSPHNYAVVQRLRFIDFLLAQFGYANRSHISDYFGISTPQATKDMKSYMKLAPDNMRYSNKRKRYTRTVDFERVWA